MSFTLKSESSIVHATQNGAIAQLGERLHGMQEVGGSIPPSSTIYFRKIIDLYSVSAATLCSFFKERGFSVRLMMTFGFSPLISLSCCCDPGR